MYELFRPTISTGEDTIRQLTLKTTFHSVPMFVILNTQKKHFIQNQEPCLERICIQTHIHLASDACSSDTTITLKVKHTFRTAVMLFCIVLTVRFTLTSFACSQCNKQYRDSALLSLPRHTSTWLSCQYYRWQ